jgi:hypothetical protein
MILFDHQTGYFLPNPIEEVPDLRNMRVELDYGPGTVFSHWDEEGRHKKEIMTGFKDSGEYVLPVSIDVMKLLGHQVIKRLQSPTFLSTLLPNLQAYQFQMINDANSLDRDYFKETELVEEIYVENGVFCITPRKGIFHNKTSESHSSGSCINC